jgi:opacity protein-like surface antigen
MSKVLLAASVAAASLVAAPALAADLIVDAPMAPMTVAEADWYVSLFAGGVWTSAIHTDFGADVAVTSDPGYTLGIAVGTHVFENLRGEVELSYGRVEANDVSYDGGPADPVEGPISALYLLGNLWYELDIGSGVKPYIGGGLGAGYATADTFFNGNIYGYGPGGVGFAYQVGAGVTFDVSDSMSVDVGYRYKNILGVDFDDNDGSGVYEDGDVSSHVLQAGLTFKF